MKKNLLLTALWDILGGFGFPNQTKAECFKETHVSSFGYCIMHNEEHFVLVEQEKMSIFKISMVILDTHTIRPLCICTPTYSCTGK